MKYIPVALRSVIIITLLPFIVCVVTASGETGLAEQTIESIEDCMEQLPSTWPAEWKKEYLETIRKAVESHRDASNFAERLEIRKNGFGPYWQSFKKTTERSFFDLHCARIRWYTEHLMGSEFPSEEDKQKLRAQYTDIYFSGFVFLRYLDAGGP